MLLAHNTALSAATFRGRERRNILTMNYITRNAPPARTIAFMVRMGFIRRSLPSNFVIALTLGAALVSPPSIAGDTLSGIKELLTRNSVICADFIQSKSLRALKRPLVSRGNLIYIAQKGVLWRVLEPFPTQVLIKSDALIIWNDDGKPQRNGFEQAPIFGALSRVFLAVFAGDVDRLRKTFEIEANLDKSNWRLKLTPRNAGFAAIIAHVRASGGKFVDEIQIQEGRGDQTLIKFTGMNTKSCKLDDVEKGYFAH